MFVIAFFPKPTGWIPVLDFSKARVEDKARSGILAPLVQANITSVGEGTQSLSWEDEPTTAVTALFISKEHTEITARLN